MGIFTLLAFKKDKLEEMKNGYKLGVVLALTTITIFLVLYMLFKILMLYNKRNMKIRLKKRKFIIFAVILGILFLWFLFNPIGKFGLHFFGLTVYSGIPYPYVDLVVDSSSIFPKIRETKSHFITEEEFYKIIGEKVDAWPEYVIIGTGYENRVKVSGGILIRGTNPRIEILPTPEAIELFNKLKSQGIKVKSIIHSTC